MSGKAKIAAAATKVAAAKVLLKGVPAAQAKVGKQALDEEAPAEEAPAEEVPAEDAAAAAGDDDEPKKKVLGASGEEVFGAKNGAVAGFLGFQDKGEPNFLGMSLGVDVRGPTAYEISISVEGIHGCGIPVGLSGGLQTC